MLIQPLLTRLDELESKATKNWRHTNHGESIHSDTLYVGGPGESDTEEEQEQHAIDLEFICQFRNAYPTLRAEIERLQEVERKYEELRK